LNFERVCSQDVRSGEGADGVRRPAKWGKLSENKNAENSQLTVFGIFEVEHG